MKSATSDGVGERWRLDALFSSLHGDDYRQARRDLLRQVDDLEALMSENGICEGPPLGAAQGQVEHQLLDTLIETWNRLLRLLSDINMFLSGHTSVDAFDEEAQAESSTLRGLRARLAALDAQATAWVGRLDLTAACAASPTAAAHWRYLADAQARARHLMSDESEALAARLAPSGGMAWVQLYDDLVGRVSTELTLPGEDAPRTLGLAGLVALRSDADRQVRAAAHEAELELFDTHAIAFAAAMNGVKGEMGTLQRLRGWPSALHATLHSNRIGQAALDAMQHACREAYPQFHRYLAAKARALGLPRLAWYDLFAPIPTDEPKTFTWPQAAAFVTERFGAFGADLADLARRAVQDGWIDVYPRPGKTNGAFCMGSPGIGQSRILLNFAGELDDVFTLAHELGHAYHNDRMTRAGRSPLQTRTPMVMAETASIFSETLVVGALLDEADDQTRLAVLEQSLQGATQLVLDIDARFRFESAVFEARAERELSVAELDRLMVEAQKASYGEAVDPATLHHRQWAQKGHYYSTGRSFYNYPYTFGYLFSLGLYARYLEEGASFVRRYDQLLASTGMADVASLGKGFGIDVEDPAFWVGALQVAGRRVNDYESLIDGLN